MTSIFAGFLEMALAFFEYQLPVFQNLFLDGIEGVSRKKAEIKGQAYGQRPKHAVGDLSIHFSKLGKDQLANKQEESVYRKYFSMNRLDLSKKYKQSEW